MPVDVKTSVLINNYNQAPYLRACVESVLQQTRRADEIVVYDDGSDDGSLEVLREFGQRISVIAGERHRRPHRINQGNAIYQAFRHSTGDFVFLLDGDDLFHPRRLERYVAEFARTGAVMVQSPLSWVDARGEPCDRLDQAYKHTTDPLQQTYRRHDPDFFYPTSALAFRRDFLNTALPIDWSDGINLWSDTRLSLAALLVGPIVTLDEELGAWRQHRHSDSARARAASKSYLLVQTWRRTAVFNRLSRAANKPTISPWRNRRFYLQALRILMPHVVYRIYEKTVRRPVSVAPANSR